MTRNAEHSSVSVAEQVRNFYDHYPYPPPIENLEEYQLRWQDHEKRRADYHLYWPGKSYREDQSILIAGCGTSQADKHAVRWPDAHVTAIDCSATSVHYTEQLKEKYELKNLEVHQLPLERVSDLGTSFDQIVCTGVLHHLADPDAGLAALRSALKPDGVMNSASAARVKLRCCATRRKARSCRVFTSIVDSLSTVVEDRELQLDTPRAYNVTHGPGGRRARTDKHSGDRHD